MTLLRPGHASLVWLRRAVGELQAADRLQAVSVVVASPYIGRVVQQALAEVGCVNVRPVTLRQVAARVSGYGVDAEKRELTGALEGAAIRLALQDASAAPFATIAHHQSLHDSLGALFRELRHVEDPSAALRALAERGTVPQAAAATFRRFVALSADFYGAPELTRIAASVADSGASRWVESLGALVLYMPSRLDAAEIALLGRLGRHIPIHAALPRLGEAAADRMMTGAAKQLTVVLDATLDRDAPSSEAVAVDVGGNVISAPDPAEEVRTVVRHVVADLEQGVPLWQIAVLYAGEATHGGALREALDAAMLPWHATTGRPLAACWAARSLVGLLGLPDRRFAREAVLEWLADRPPIGADADDPLPAIPVSTWDRLSRQAKILEGSGQWIERLEKLAHGLGHAVHQDDSPEDGDAEGAALRAAVSDGEAATSMARAIARLRDDLHPPADGASWDAFVDWASELRVRYLPMSETWPEAERAGSAAVDAALDGLREAGMFEGGTNVDVLRTALATMLESRREPEGTFGRGVVVGPVGSTVGAAYRRVYALGLIEGVLPSRPVADPLAGAHGQHDPLERHERAREDERRGFLAALAAADDGATVSYARSDGAARATYPSPWLMEFVSQREGATVYASGLPTLLAVGRPWLTRIASAQDGVARVGDGALPAADLADRRLASLVAWRDRGGELARHPLAVRADLPLGAALRASRARRSRDFTPYDGNLLELAGRSGLMTRAFTRGKLSATSLERWARCPFQYLLVDVLRVQATRRPEDEWTITALDRGDVVHRILERFFRELHGHKRLRNGDRIAASDHESLEEIAAEVFAELEQTGQAGHPLAWENAKAAIVVELHELLEKDQSWRDADGLIPARFEQRFGRQDDPDSWPSVTIALSDGREVSFGGIIDRIDVTKGPPPRALIVDYKSGSAGSYKEIEDDPVAGGRHVQLALYAEALRSRIGADESWAIQAEYRFVTARGGFAKVTVDADPSLGERLRRVLAWAADGIEGGTFLAVPGARDRGTFANCGYCDYDRVCSTTRDDVWARKQHWLPMLDGPFPDGSARA